MKIQFHRAGGAGGFGNPHERLWLINIQRSLCELINAFNPSGMTFL